MSEVDLNLLPALDALLSEGSVAGAARRLGLSASAMSRTLTRLREATGDPLLVRAGQKLMPTPHAEQLRARVREAAHEAALLLRPAAKIPTIDRTFVIRANDGFVEVFGARLLAAALHEAPAVRLRFAPKADKDIRPLREGLVDLEIGVIGEAGPELRVQALFRDRFVGAARTGHPLFEADVTPERYAACGHVVVSRRGEPRGPVDIALETLGLSRKIVAIAPGFSAALAFARSSDLIALVTQSFFAAAGRDLQAFPLPVETAPITVSALWHPRMEADPAHRWLRELLVSACRDFAVAQTFSSPAPPARSPAD